MSSRGGQVAVVAHCLLNANTKVHGLARYRGAHAMVRELLLKDVALVQLPCPELAHLGMLRWGMTREQYEVPCYRRLCRQLLEAVVDELAALAADGCEILGIWGVDGSPSCGVNRTCIGFVGGEIGLLSGCPESTETAGEGVFISELRALLSERGLDLRFQAVAESE